MKFMLRFLSRLPGFIAGALIFSTLHAGTSSAAEPVDADLLLVNGTIHIGDGLPAQLGDVAIVDDRIVAVGKFEVGTTKQRIDCTGLVVSPGFIDLHNHSDTPATRKETRSCVNYLTQGCTTIVTGNCGSGPVDAGAYYDTLDEHGIGLNIAHLLPQGSLRGKVMQSERREATVEELNQMKTLAAQAMKDGAWGMSTGLIYVPSSYADTHELVEIAKVVSEHGGIYASHIRGEGNGLLDAVKEALQIGRDAAIPIHVSHFKSSGKDSWGLVRVAIEIIRKEREAGRIVTADQYPYIASSTSLAATFLPPWARAGGTKQMLERLEPGPEYARIETAIRKKLAATDQGQRVQIARYRPEPGWAGKRLKEIADEMKLEPFDLLLQTLKNDSGTKIVNFGINEDDVRYVMQQPWVATASDGSAKIPTEDIPHPRNYGTFPRKIGHYSVREGVVPLTQAIRSSTGLPADILGLRDRGYLRVGMVADIAVWSEKELIDKATFDKPHRYCEGIRYLLVNGTPAIWNGDITGTLAGQALRHEPTSRRDVAITEVNDVVRRYFPNDSNGGLAVLVTRNGEAIHSKGYGTVRANESVTSVTSLRLASITKQFASMCAAMLIEAGKLDLAANVSHYLPDLNLQTKGRELHIEDLLRHTSGLPNFVSKKEKESIDAFKKERGLSQLNNETHAEWLTTIPPRRPPGQKYEYTNSGYVLLTRIIEVIAREPFHQFQKRRLFDVLEMDNTTDSTRFNGSGSMATTLEDYAKWDRAIWQKDDRLLTPAGYKMLFSRGALDNGEPVDYGFGWKLTYRDGQLVSADHGGWGSGTTAARNQIKRSFENNTTVAVFAQEYPEFGRLTEHGRKLREVFVEDISNAIRQLTKNAIEDTK